MMSQLNGAYVKKITKTNKPMKLYTEEELLKAIQLGRNYGGWVTTEPEILKQLTPIELPSDEEIEDNAISSTSEFDYEERISFEKGAKWMKEQLL